MNKLSRFALLIVVTVCTSAMADVSLSEKTLGLAVSGAHQLKLSGAEGTNLRWHSSTPQVAAVYGNGFVVGLRIGDATISIEGASSTCHVHVSADAPKIIDPATLKQFDDEREFTVNGRKCFGSELNGQRADDPAEHQFLDSNRVINPSPLKPDRPLEWQVEDRTEVRDGAGSLMGTVAAKFALADAKRVPTAKFNFGMSKVIDGTLYIYAFSTPIVPDKRIAPLVDPKDLGNGAVETSAWVPLDCVIDRDALVERIGLGKPALPALPLKDESYTITGGDPKMYMTDVGEEFAIVKRVRENNAVPSHYLRRPSGTVNLLYSVPGFGLGGQGVDSFLVTSGAVFRPAKGAREFVQPTYFPSKHPQVGQVSPMTMTFIYGAVELRGAAPVYGWIAKEALTAQTQ